VEFDLVQYENKIDATKVIHSLNLLSENSLEDVQKSSKKDYLLINATWIQLST